MQAAGSIISWGMPLCIMSCFTFLMYLLFPSDWESCEHLAAQLYRTAGYWVRPHYSLASKGILLGGEQWVSEFAQQEQDNAPRPLLFLALRIMSTITHYSQSCASADWMSCSSLEKHYKHHSWVEILCQWFTAGWQHLPALLHEDHQILKNTPLLSSSFLCLGLWISF